MSMVRIITRIIPPNTQDDCFSHLLAANEIDTPIRTEWSSSGDPSTGHVVMAETTYCKEDAIPPNVDLDSAIASKCNKISGLVCLKKSRLRLTTESNDNGNAGFVTEASRAPIIKVNPEVLTDGSCSGILLSIPLRIPRCDIPGSSVISNCGPMQTEEHCVRADQDPAMQQEQNQNIASASYSVFPTCNGETEQSDWNKFQHSSLKDAVEPLRKYFKDNKCLLCGFVSSNEWEYAARRHLETHLKEQNFKCNVCDKSFRSPLLLHYHKTTHKTELKFTCDTCGKKFKGKGRLVVHMKTHNEETIKCPFCDSKFKYNKNLKKHMTIHTGDLPYQCTVCHDRFPTSDVLHNHSLQHTKKNRFQCEICGKGFNKKAVFEEHRNMHNDEGSCKCEMCDKMFNFKSNLEQHMLTHSDVRKHTCETCGMKFKLPHHLESHIATHDPQVTETPEL